VNPQLAKNKKKKGNLFNRRQWKILKLRANGLTQLETARKLRTSRANISMIEWRAKQKLKKARETLQAYEALQNSEK
jgi:HTH-type transcriptional regulator, fmd operon transcriptional regulator